MAIQMRRGLIADVDPSKMLPGEWGVTIDKDTNLQIVLMCFEAGIVKRMGTYEDFKKQIADATDDIRQEYLAEFQEILDQIDGYVEEVRTDTNTVVTIRGDFLNTYLPKIENAVDTAETMMNEAISSATTATDKASESASSAEQASEYADMSKSYAVGTDGTVREGDSTDNSKYYYEQAKQISQGLNGLIPMGTIAFEELPTSDIAKNAMYNISNAFTSDSRFADGGGKPYGAGSNVYYTSDGKWDVLAASTVMGVKGAKESTYRQGNVNITCENIGALAVDGDSKDNTVTFTSGDSADPTGWTDVGLMTSGEKHNGLLAKISNMFKNIRFLHSLVNQNSQSTIYAIEATNTRIDEINTNLDGISTKLGDNFRLEKIGQVPKSSSVSVSTGQNCVYLVVTGQNLPNSRSVSIVFGGQANNSGQKSSVATIYVGSDVEHTIGSSSGNYNVLTITNKNTGYAINYAIYRLI